MGSDLRKLQTVSKGAAGGFFLSLSFSYHFLSFSSLYSAHPVRS